MRMWLPILAATALLASVPPATSQAVTTPKRCGKVTADGKRYAVRGHLVGCKFARRWSKRFLRRGRHGRGWSCQRYRGSSIKFVCRRNGKSYYAIKK
jgi:hypothetical protein